MAKRRIPMRPIREMLRLHHTGLSAIGPWARVSAWITRIHQGHDVGIIVVGIAAGASPKCPAYSQFCLHYRRWRKCLDVVPRQFHAPDYAGPTVPVIG